jgi:hypothetical protein
VEKMEDSVVQRLKEFVFAASPGEILAYQDRAMQNICGGMSVISTVLKCITPMLNCLTSMLIFCGDVDEESKTLGKKMKGKIREWNEETGGDFTFVKVSVNYLPH